MSFSAPPSATDYGWRPPTTYVDVLFLILTFFITIAAYRDTDRQIDVSLQETQSAKASVGPATQIVITVRSDGTLYMGERAHTMESLTATLHELAEQFPDESVLIRGDRKSDLGTVIRVMDLCYAAKLRNVFIATTKPRSEL
ncbi:MAG: biopolymer transporter ExbD [Planctomycetota bacterium]|nr:biopolymer transporter ExbD [Planctomycetota bacterium]